MGYYSSRSRDRFSAWAPYVSVAERRTKAAAHVAAQKKKGKDCNPVVIEGRTIAKSFWGKAWCDNLEKYSDYENRLPRGRTYARNGSIIDLQITKGVVSAQVMGSSLYNITITIIAMAQDRWQSLVDACSGKIDSLIELLQGKFSKAVMEIITEKEQGLFPKPKEISMKCSCPDSAGMCKHIAAVLYGVGAMLDVKPEWLFTLRHVDHMDLIATAAAGGALLDGQGSSALDDSDLSALFGIEMAAEAVSQPVPAAPKTRAKRASTKKTDPEAPPKKTRKPKTS
jgi:uncharacterized Zn finger protein